MGLSETGGIMAEVGKVYAALLAVYDAFPGVIKLLIFGVFGLVVFVGVLRSLGR